MGIQLPDQRFACFICGPLVSLHIGDTFGDAAIQGLVVKLITPLEPHLDLVFRTYFLFLALGGSILAMILWIVFLHPYYFYRLPKLS